MNANFVGGIVEIANGEEQSKVQNKTETMTPTVEQPDHKCLDPLIKDLSINVWLYVSGHFVTMNIVMKITKQKFLTF